MNGLRPSHDNSAWSAPCCIQKPGRPHVVQDASLAFRHEACDALLAALPAALLAALLATLLASLLPALLAALLAALFAEVVIRNRPASVVLLLAGGLEFWFVICWSVGRVLYLAVCTAGR
jgi:hypothetical protein